MIAVDAVKTDSQLEQIEHLLLKRGQLYSDIWLFGINTALRISDLLEITTEQIKAVDPLKRELTVIEGKTKKPRVITLNELAIKVVSRRVAENPKDKSLWQSTSPRKKHTHKHISREQVARVLKRVGEQITPQVQLSTHSMRKTRGYFLHKQGAPIELICKTLNHSSPAITMRYIGLDAERIKATYDDCVIGNG